MWLLLLWLSLQGVAQQAGAEGEEPVPFPRQVPGSVETVLWERRGEGCEGERVVGRFLYSALLPRDETG